MSSLYLVRKVDEIEMLTNQYDDNDENHAIF